MVPNAAALLSAAHPNAQLSGGGKREKVNSLRSRAD
jgi:hypothetical protein